MLYPVLALDPFTGQRLDLDPPGRSEVQLMIDEGLRQAAQARRDTARARRAALAARLWPWWHRHSRGGAVLSG